MKYFDIAISIFLGFFTGILLSDGGDKLYESGIHILLGSIFWLIVLIYLRIPIKAQNNNKKDGIN